MLLPMEICLFLGFFFANLAVFAKFRHETAVFVEIFLRLFVLSQPILSFCCNVDDVLSEFRGYLKRKLPEKAEISKICTESKICFAEVCKTSTNFRNR